MSQKAVKNTNQIEKDLLCDCLNSKIAHKSSESSLDDFYHSILHHVVDSLIDLIQSPGECGSSNFCDSATKEIIFKLAENGIHGPDGIASFYERTSGLKLEKDRRGQLVLVPSKYRKHARGQFYTPRPVARKIIKLSLDSAFEHRQDFVSGIDILDPAVGCGVFLDEAVSCFAEKCAKAAATASGFKFPTLPVLHGVDVDPVSVKIAQAILESRLKSMKLWPDIGLPYIRVGNSLIGDFCDPVSGAVLSKPKMANTDETGNYCLYTKVEKQEPISNLEFNWYQEFPHVFDRLNPGFDIIVGNPPYEVLSAKESSSRQLLHEINYFRSNYKTCSGKINTYRLMMERSLNLLRVGGVMGFIVPSTFLADTSAAALRRAIISECEIRDLITIPEKARLFPGVTQAFSIIIAQKGKPTRIVKPRMWHNTAISDGAAVPGILVRDLEKSGLRIPVLSSILEGRLMSHLMTFPSLSSGFSGFRPINVHQGEINMTTHRSLITSSDTGLRLVRGEHVGSFVVRHPSSAPNKLDWVTAEIFQHQAFKQPGLTRFLNSQSGCDSREGRVAIARVVNMDCEVRLKAAWVEPEVFLGDMTNYLDSFLVSPEFTLGLLNSSLLNWRFKLLSANNYVSSAEISSLPVPRLLCHAEKPGKDGEAALNIILSEVGAAQGLRDALVIIDKTTRRYFAVAMMENFLVFSVETLVGRIMEDIQNNNKLSSDGKVLRLLMDALVMKLYSAEPFTDILDARGNV